MSEWIKCSERMPVEGVLVIGSGMRHKAFGGGRWVEAVIYECGEFHPPALCEETGDIIADGDSTMNETTHWMPLPPPPAD